MSLILLLIKFMFLGLFLRKQQRSVSIHLSRNYVTQTLKIAFDLKKKKKV